MNSIEIDKLMPDSRQVAVVAVVCLQWGDTGKGKIVDCLADWADIIVRATGGANAGHTIQLDDKVFVFHMVPSGLLHKKTNMIGSGVVLDPRQLLNELEVLGKAGLPWREYLKIAYNAKLVLPHHILLDHLRETEDDCLGTTKRGIGPAYEDHVGRIGLIVNDLLNVQTLESKLKAALKEKVRLFKTYDQKIIKEIMDLPALNSGRYYSPEDIIDIETVVKDYASYGKQLSYMIHDTDSFIKESLYHKKILLEGAQGTMLSIDHGTYPYVTSSDCSLAGLAKGAGLMENDIGVCLGIVKAPYMTRVGRGPFPTEIGGNSSASWCNSNAAIYAGHHRTVKEMEADEYKNIVYEEADEFRKGIWIRMRGDEYGATTGRPRRTGWLDLPLLRYAKKWNKNGIILTKPDVMSGCKIVKICTAYHYNGIRYRFGQNELSAENGSILTTAIPQTEIMKDCSPVYESFPGYPDIRSARSWSGLPSNFKDIVEFIEEKADVKVKAISVGPKRDQIIYL